MTPSQQPQNETLIIPNATDTNPPPPVGMTPPQMLAQGAAEGSRGAAWRLLHWLMEGDPRAFLAVASLDDDRLAQHLLEFIAQGTWAGKAFVVPDALRSPLARTHLRTLFLPGSGMKTARAERVLLAGLRDRRAVIRENAARILGILGSVSAINPLIEIVKDPVVSVRMQVVKALGRIGKQEAVPALLGVLRAADEQLGGMVHNALVQIGPPAVPFLLKDCNHSSAWIRWHCVRALGEICDYRALPNLVRALSDPDHSVAWLAARGLTRYGRWSVEPVLKHLAAADTSPWLAETAAYVLRDVYQHDQKFKIFLEPVIQSTHEAAYRIGTPNAARKALAELAAHGLILTPS
jgi:HEAT repeat protein